MTYQECTDFLFNSLPVFQRIGAAAYKENLDNTYTLLNRLENPHKRFPSIHVAGTNGKGSVSHNLASICMECGFRTGLYTSPHLKDFRERIQIDGVRIREDFVVDFVESNRRIILQIQPSFFEMTVAMAFSYFAQKEVDIAIVEVGMGGRLDSTNVIAPLLSIITNISYDHTAFLGNTLEKIAAEKAGIIKPYTPIIVGETHPETTEILTRTASKNRAPILFADQHYEIAEWETVSTNSRHGVEFTVTQKGQHLFDPFFSPLSGDYQRHNVITTLAACRVLGAGIFRAETIAKGFAECVNHTRLQGRWQILQQTPLCIADTAHNEAGIAYVFRQIARMPYKRLHIVLGMVSDKDTQAILPLLPKQAQYYFCKANIPRGMDVERLLAEAARFDLRGDTYPSVRAAFAAARESAEKNDLVFVGGSTFTVAEVV
jgi:dihydrofolate synthase/folylpolyglutamate synthase